MTLTLDGKAIKRYRDYSVEEGWVEVFDLYFGWMVFEVRYGRVEMCE